MVSVPTPRQTREEATRRDKPGHRRSSKVGPVQCHRGDLNFQIVSLSPPTLPLNLPRISMVLIHCKRILNKNFLWIIGILLGSMTHVIYIIISFIILCVVITWPLIKYPTNTTSGLGIWTLKCLIPSTNYDIMGGHQCTREVYV